MSCRTIAVLALALGVVAILATPSAHASDAVTLDARLAQPVMKDGAAARNYLRVGLGGCRPEPAVSRTPVNVAFVIDRSGSMQGHRIAQAREAAVMAVSRLQANDIASVVVFDQIVDILVPAQPVTDANVFADLIRRVQVRGTTAIHAGVLTGAAEVRKFKDPGRLNRVVLLSDGQANVGPARPSDFDMLGRALLAEGISVSTIGLGLGYNEDLMLALARAADGNHAFARDPSDLITIFNREFNDVLASCAQTVAIDIELKPGVRAVRALSRDGTIEGSKAQFRLNQIYAATEHYVLLEVEVDRDLAAAGEQELGSVKVAYTQAPSGGGAPALSKTLSAAIHGRFTSSEAEIKAGADDKVAEAVVEQVVLARSQQAIDLRDQGKFEEARQLLQQNATDINVYAASAKNAPAHLLGLARQYNALAAEPAPRSAEQAGEQRKTLRALQAPAAGALTRY
jgi:Ca-activated chloride channel family protein